VGDISEMTMADAFTDVELANNNRLVRAAVNKSIKATGNQCSSQVNDQEHSEQELIPRDRVKTKTTK
jgi:hypothetical protein